MKKTKVFYLVVVLAVSALLLSAVNARAVSEEARRHMDRGQAAVEMANAPEDYEAAIKEFKQAIRLAPTWPAPYYSLGLAQEKAGKLKEAVASLKQYLRIAPNAPDAAKIQEQIYKLEYKAEQTLTTPEIIEALVSFSGWEAENHQGCRTSRKELFLWRQGDNAVYVPTFTVPDVTGEFHAANSKAMEVAGPVLKYVTVSNVCSESVYDNNHDKWPDYCFYQMENEIKVVSKTLVKVSQNRISGGSGVTKCTFQKK